MSRPFRFGVDLTVPAPAGEWRDRCRRAEELGYDVLPAREAATTDALTGGRLELDIGAGYVRAEHVAAGLPFGSPGERVDRVRRTVRELKRLLESADHQPRPRCRRARRPVPACADRPRRSAAAPGARGTTGHLVPSTAEELDASVAAYRT
ncbi:hypothetical protein SUDANB145_06237 [Streptomyces sp. enrichment culture]